MEKEKETKEEAGEISVGEQCWDYQILRILDNALHQESDHSRGTESKRHATEKSERHATKSVVVRRAEEHDFDRSPRERDRVIVS